MLYLQLRDMTMTDFTLSSIYYWLHDGQTAQPEASPQRPVCGWRGSYQGSWAERSHCVSTHESFLEPAENKLSNGQTHQMQSSRTWMTLYMASSLTMSCSTGNIQHPTRRKEFKWRQASLTLLILNSPSKRHPWPLLRGTFIEFSMWPTSCRPISSWMSKPTTAYMQR